MYLVLGEHSGTDGDVLSANEDFPTDVKSINSNDSKPVEIKKEGHTMSGKTHASRLHGLY